MIEEFQKLKIFVSKIGDFLELFYLPKTMKA